MSGRTLFGNLGDSSEILQKKNNKNMSKHEKTQIIYYMKE